MTTAGDIKILVMDHPELGSRTFDCKSGEDANVMTGGFKSNDDDGNIGASGKRVNQKNRYPWSLEPTIEANAGDLDYLQSASESTQEATVTATFMDDEIRSGQGLPVGDLTENKQTSVIAFKIAGSGRFEIIS